jgi:hypothetical protein
MLNYRVMFMPGSLLDGCTNFVDNKLENAGAHPFDAEGNVDVTALRGLITVATRFDPAFFITRAAMNARIDAFQQLAEVPAEGKGDQASVPRVPDS